MATEPLRDVTTIWAIGRNYGKHALEMGAATPTTPVVFIKSPACLVTNPNFGLPNWSSEVHHEIELAVRVGENNKPTHVALALDLTARDAQTELKEKRLPWARAKTFRDACPISGFVPFESQTWFENLTFRLSVDEDLRQVGEVKDMVFQLPELLSHLEEYYPLRPGDLILTGTPQGVGPLRRGSRLEAEISGVLKMSWSVDAK